MQIGIPRERLTGVPRVAATPETVTKYVAAKHTVLVESGAGTRAHFPDDAYVQAGAQIVDAARALGAGLVLKVRSPDASELPQMKSGAVLIGMLAPFDQEGLARLAGAGTLGGRRGGKESVSKCESGGARAP